MSIPVCKFYILNQTCRFGKKCRYSHSSQRPLDPGSSFDHKDEDSTSTVENFPDQSIKDSPQGLNIQCENESSLNDNSVCSSKSNSSSVPNKSNINNKAYSSSKDAVLPTRNIGSAHKTKSSSICRNFARSGYCYYGKNCHYVHSNFNSGNPESSTSGSGRHVGRSSYSSAPRNVPPRFSKGNRGPSSATVSHPSKAQDNLHLNQSDEILNNQENSKAGISGASAGPGVGGRESSTVKSQYLVEKKQQCPFFKARRCYRGSKCKFLHDRRSTEGDDGEVANDSIVNERSDKVQANETRSLDSIGNKKAGLDVTIKNGKPQQAGIGGKQVLTHDELKEFGIVKVRDVEINVIKRRFPQDKITIVKEDENKFSARIIFTPSDPDWPFDVKVFEMLLSLPSGYPENIMTVKLPTDQNMPETVRKCVEVSINTWLQDRANVMKGKGKVELVFRPFLRWLDKDIEEIFTEALKQLKRDLVAKAAGMEFFSPAELREKLRGEGSDGDEDSDSAGSDDSDEESSEEESGSDDDEEEEDEDDHQPSIGLDLDPEKKGTQIELRHLQLRENASALLLDRLKLVLQCGRCKTHADVQLPQNKVMSLSCFKCSQNQFVHYRASLAHQFSSVIGYLDLDGCQAFDLVLQDCRAVVTCLGCSKLTRVDGLVAGQMSDGWCQACHAKFKVATEAVKFTQLAPSGIDSTAQHQKVKVTKAHKPPKDPAIREGYPLPEFGTCRHYKHSYRWLRFPCCGKAYPCDVCHDKKEDHEFVFANRMICGHCCKEQNYSASRPCTRCGQHMTKVRSAHWEGGKGCRDQISMSKADHAKYRNQNKTVSNHKKQMKPTGKKNTKLRRP